jgi:hypothetical protein
MCNSKAIMAGLIAAASLAVTANATPTVRFNDTENNWNTNDGFLADLGADGSYDYTTFCVEIQEPIALGVVYEYGVSTSVKNRGGDGPLSLDNATGYAVAFIFSTFDAGGETAIESLSGTAGLTDSQYRELTQRTIWNKLFGGYDNATFTQTMIDQLFANASGQWDSLHNVRVMNVWEDFANQTGGRQDMLVVVPLPSGAGLASLGLLGLAATGRRRKI